MAATLSPPPRALKPGATRHRLPERPRAVLGGRLLEDAGGPVDEHRAGGGDALPRTSATVSWPMSTSGSSTGRSADPHLDARAVLDAGEVDGQHDLVAVLGEDGLRLRR